MARKYYVVRNWKIPWIYDSREEAKTQVTGFPNAKFKSFSNYDVAKAAYEGNYIPHKWRLDVLQLYELMGEEFEISIATDAACPHNPGPVEYRGVILATSEEIFNIWPLEHGSVNLWEFLAIVHGLAWLLEHPDYSILYSDSTIAINWVNNNYINTSIPRHSSNKKLWRLLDHAQERLTTHPDWSSSIELKKRPTQERGQIPADFWRK